MADRIRAIGRLQASTSGTFRQLGAKRAASVLWKAVVKGDFGGVKRTIENNKVRYLAHEKVWSAKGELISEGTFTNDLDGLRQLLDRARQTSLTPKSDDPAIALKYRLAFFDEAWVATIDKGKFAVRYCQDLATIRATLRSHAASRITANLITR